MANGQVPSWQTDGPQIEEDEFLIELPIELLAGKIYLNIEMGGQPRQFVLDTGSPSMISASLAAELGLQTVGKSQGVDAHGVTIESNIVQAELGLGGIRLRNVPMFVADFSSSAAAQCLLGDGILGSEVLPLCVWQIDLPDSTLRCASRKSQLDHLRGSSQQKLHSYGYPHTPYLDTQLAKQAKSKAMFDTGSAPLFVISPPDLAGTQRVGGIAGYVYGEGSSGTSLGGKSPNRRQQKAAIKRLAIGNLKLGKVEAVQRDLAPSLVGSSILEEHVVTLDSAAGKIYFDRYRKRSPQRSSFGFALSFDGGTHVSLVWDNSPAAQAGLEVGQKVLALNDIPADSSCPSIRDALTSLQGDSLKIEWAGGTAELKRP